MDAAEFFVGSTKDDFFAQWKWVACLARSDRYRVSTTASGFDVLDTLFIDDRKALHSCPLLALSCFYRLGISGGSPSGPEEDHRDEDRESLRADAYDTPQMMVNRYILVCDILHWCCPFLLLETWSLFTHGTVYICGLSIYLFHDTC